MVTFPFSSYQPAGLTLVACSIVAFFGVITEFKACFEANFRVKAVLLFVVLVIVKNIILAGKLEIKMNTN